MNRRQIALCSSLAGVLIAADGITAIVLDYAKIGAPLLVAGILGIAGCMEYSCTEPTVSEEVVISVRPAPLKQIVVAE